MRLTTGQTTRKTTEPLLFTVAEVMQRLHLGRSMVYRLINDGEIPSMRIGRAMRIPREPLLAWIARNTYSAPED